VTTCTLLRPDFRPIFLLFPFSVIEESETDEIKLDFSSPLTKTRGNWPKPVPEILIVFGLWNEAELIVGELLIAVLKTAVIV